MRHKDLEMQGRKAGEATDAAGHGELKVNMRQAWLSGADDGVEAGEAIGTSS
jgi:hypothetical protein